MFFPVTCLLVKSIRRMPRNILYGLNIQKNNHSINQSIRERLLTLNVYLCFLNSENRFLQITNNYLKWRHSTLKDFGFNYAFAYAWEKLSNATFSTLFLIRSCLFLIFVLFSFKHLQINLHYQSTIHFVQCHAEKTRSTCICYTSRFSTSWCLKNQLESIWNSVSWNSVSYRR